MAFGFVILCESTKKASFLNKRALFLTHLHCTHPSFYGDETFSLRNITGANKRASDKIENLSILYAVMKSQKGPKVQETLCSKSSKSSILLYESISWTGTREARAFAVVVA